MFKTLGILFIFTLLFVFNTTSIRAQFPIADSVVRQHGQYRLFGRDTFHRIVVLSPKLNVAIRKKMETSAAVVLAPGIFVMSNDNIEQFNKSFIDTSYIPAFSWKLSGMLQEVMLQQRPEQYQFYVRCKQGTNAALLFSGMVKVQPYWDATLSVAVFTGSVQDVLMLIKNPLVLQADVMVAKPQPENGTPGFDLSANKLNKVFAAFPLLQGTGEHISIKEEMFDTLDIDLTGRIAASPLASAATSNHASFMATIAAGAGNSSSYATGAARRATISSASFAQVLPEPVTYYNDAGIGVQNHSYGSSIDNRYGVQALAFDKSALDKPDLLHVFSAGNSGQLSAANGTYTGLNSMANLTGNFKMAKNVLVVGSADSLGRLVMASSSGPAYDGRIKPDITAFQMNGTSESAALVSGTALLLRQQYRQQYGVALPAALAKALLINSADDISLPGPDYRTGFGNLNAYQAIQTLTSGQFYTGTVSQASNTVSFALTVSPNTALFKCTLVWADTIAAAFAPVALVNDLDLTIAHQPTSKQWQPWVLRTQPREDSLLLPARRGRDSLNNAEQITIAHPEPGNYIIHVDAKFLGSTQQRFYLAYQLAIDSVFEWQYPAKGDIVTASAPALLRWFTNTADTGTIEYSTQPNVWRSLANNVLAEKGSLYWTVPDTNCRARLRFKRNNQWIYSDSFWIAAALKPSTGFICADSFALYWPSAKGVSQYQLYRLGAIAMEPLQRVSDSFIVLRQQAGGKSFFAVAPVIDGFFDQAKSYGFNYQFQGAGCFINTFYGSVNGNAAQLNAELGAGFQIDKVFFEIQEAGGFRVFANYAAPVQSSYGVLFDNLPDGVSIFRLRLQLKNGSIIVSNPLPLYHARTGFYQLYPVPATRGTTVYLLRGETAEEQLQLFDASGRQVLSMAITDKLTPISTNILPPGFYSYTIMQAGSRKKTGRVLIQ